MSGWLWLLLELLVTAALMYLMWWLGYRQGYRKAMAVRVEELAKNARQRANAAKAKADVLEGQARPHIARVRIKGTSRRDLGD